MQFLSIVFCQECIFLYVFCRNLYALSIVFCPKSRFSLCILSRMRFCLYILCRNLHAFSIVFCSNAVFFPLYFGQNDSFYLFCRKYTLFSVVFWGSRARLRAELASLSRNNILSRINILTYISMHTRRPEE